MRIPRSIPSLVMVQHHGQRVLKKRDLAQNPIADLRVTPHLLPLCISKAAGLTQNCIGDADLANVMEQCAAAELLALPAAQTEPRSELYSQLGDARGMLFCRGVARVDGGCQAGDRLVVARLELLGVASKVPL